MTYTKEIFERTRRPGTYGYRIIRDGEVVESEQIFKPGEDGTVDMTQAEAEAFSSAVVTDKNTPPTPTTRLEIKPILTSEQITKLITKIKSEYPSLEISEIL